MSTRIQFLLTLITLVCAVPMPSLAYPPAPFHRIYGSVRDTRGTALGTRAGTIILSGAEGQEIVRNFTDSGIGIGVNYSLSVRMDSGTTAQLYTVSALRPMLPFTIRVVINNVSYVPIEMTGATWEIGNPSESTRLDLTVGIDSDADGLPDAWEQAVIDGDLSGRLMGLNDVRPEDDLDGDALTNLQEWTAGTYALDGSDALIPKFIELKNGLARLRFLAIAGRTYSLSSSTDLTNFAPQMFSLDATGVKPGLAYLAEDVRTVDIYVPEGDTNRLYFRLHVQ
jgi:hypothetical protein